MQADKPTMGTLIKETPMKSLAPGKTGPETDLVYTPPLLAKQLIDALNPSGIVLDPCKGAGAFYNQFPGDKDWCELTLGRDFFTYDQKADWIITNPPWSLMRQFLIKGFEIADNIAYLTTINHAFTKARIRDAREHGFWISDIITVDTPKSWPQSGFQVGMIVWKRGHHGDTSIRAL